jgi:hypothetical protein
VAPGAAAKPGTANTKQPKPAVAARKTSHNHTAI